MPDKVASQLARAAALGGGLPLLIAIIMQCGWPVSRRRLVAFATSFVAGAVACQRAPVAGGLMCATVAKATYDLLYEPTGIAATIERATTINIGSITASNAVVGNGTAITPGQNTA